MKTLKTLGLLLLFSLFALKGISQEKETNTIKVISYNIWNGFEKDAARQALFTEWINQQKPDIVALEELVGINEKDLSALAASYGHPYVAIVKEEGYPVGLTSRKPIDVVKKQVEGFWHGMLHAQTYGLDIIVTHLSPFENMQGWDKSHPEYGNMRGEQFDYSVLSKFLSIGFADPVKMFVPAEQRMSYPAATLYEWQWGDPRLKMLGERLDYILVSPALAPKCLGATVHNGEELEGISDHYPVSIRMELPQ